VAIFNLRNQILKEHSKAQCITIVNWVGISQQRFDKLFHLFLTDEYLVVQRAAWPVRNCVIVHAHFITKHWSSFIKNVQKPNIHNAIKRNSICLLQDITIPKKYQGQIMDICFTYVESPTEAVAVKAFSLTHIAATIAKSLIGIEFHFF
jgi:hypothetical protein